MKIAIVNDVASVVEVLRRVVADWPEHQLLWVAQDGADAIAMCRWQLPDIVLMDIVMPNMDGVEATRCIMQATPCPILIVTADIGLCADQVYQALAYGALDAVDTPTLGGKDARRAAQVLMEKIARVGHMQVKAPPVAVLRKPLPPPKLALGSKTAAKKLVVIGASAGGPAALAVILRALPPQFTAALVIVQHIDPGFTDGMTTWLQQQSVLPVRVAREDDQPQAGTILVAGTNEHLLFKNHDTLGYVAQSPEDVYHPSIDVFFHSVARQWRATATGVLLTGMGRDGAVGLKAMRAAGFHTIAQDRQTSSVYGMPKAAAALDAASQILPLDLIAKTLANQFS